MKKKYLPLGIFAILMIGLGMSDSLRGIFLPIFKEKFLLTNAQASRIITVSYIGNLVFLLSGGPFVDKYNKKSVFLCTMGMWMSALILFSLTDNYYLLLLGIFFSMGASTLLSTMVNLISPVLFAMYQGMIINVLGFIQGIGTSFTQNIIGRYAEGFKAWQRINLALILLGIALVIATCFAKFEDSKKEATNQRKGLNKANSGLRAVIKNKAFNYLVVIFGCYFVAEHGVMNWFVSYGRAVLGLEREKAAIYLSVFFMGLTVGRLVFAPIIDRIGVEKSIMIFSALATILYTVGSFGGKSYILCLSTSGLFFSIIYPTLVLLIRRFYEVEILASATGTIISVATLFDIGFNMIFGRLIDVIGFKLSYIILPLSMLSFFMVYLIFYKTKIKDNNQIKQIKQIKI